MNRKGIYQISQFKYGQESDTDNDTICGRRRWTQSVILVSHVCATKCKWQQDVNENTEPEKKH